jgi:hypothetical protein
MEQIKAIETLYKGFRFRSRLEARWAVFFDVLGLRWDYEPQGFETTFGRYLPDFFLHCEEGTERRPGSGRWIEIKGVEDPLALPKLRDVCMATEHSGFLFYGLPSERAWHHVHHSGCIKPWPSQMPDGIGEDEESWRFYVFACMFPWVANDNVSEAVSAAKAARFEHGEQNEFMSSPSFLRSLANLIESKRKS